MTSPVRHHTLTWPAAAAVVVVASLLLAACGSSTKAATAPPPTAGSNASVTLSVANVAGLGPVLVNGNGFTLYVLPQEKGGNVTCTATGDCTKIWPAAVLPAEMSQGIAGTGVQASLLGSVKSPAGNTRLTYNGWPLYTYIGDSKPGTATGQGFKDSFGTWWALTPAGNILTTPVATTPAATTPAATAPAATTPAGAGNGGGTSTTVPASGGGVSY
jgi:predicted lipoprotein with Yx(FWY)xxD motif